MSHVDGSWIGTILAGVIGVALAACMLLAPPPAAAGTIVADSGFRPDPDGFSFPNYVNEEGYANLNPAEMQRLFGKQVCLDYKRGRCMLTPAARNWMQAQNGSMAGGHCYGFAVLSSLIEKGQLPRFGYSSLSVFGPGASPFELDVEGSRRLQRSIARAFVFQTLPSVTSRKLSKSPARTVELLRESLSPDERESWTIAIFQRGFRNGHAVTPYALDDMGSGIYDVHVYDNNWPADADRRLTIDTNRNTWKYYSATEPGQPSSWFRGNKRTGTLQLYPTRPGLGVQRCAFCAGRQGWKSKYNEITLDSSGRQHSHLLLTDDEGRRTGFVKGRFVDEIPGVEVLPRSSGGAVPATDGTLERLADSLEPVYRVPKRVAFKVKIDGRSLTRTVRERLSLVGPTYDSSVERLRMAPGEVAKLRLSPRGNELVYRGSSSTRAPRVTFGAEAKRAAYRIGVTALSARPGAPVYFVKHRRRQLLRIGDRTRRLQRYRIVIDRFTKRGKTEMSRTFGIRKGQRAYLYYGPLGKPDGVGKIVIHAPGKGQVRVLPIRAHDRG